MRNFLKLFFGILTVFIFSVLVVNVYAQDSSSSAGTRNPTVTYPIAELGSCADLASCKVYCDDPVNKGACITYAKEQGFYKVDALEVHKEAVIAQAQLELGCDSLDSCKAICDKEENIDKCTAFAKKNNLNGGKRDNPGSANIVNKAKEVLGCKSELECKAICEKEGNRQKCSDFAKKAGIRGGEQKNGPGGCISEKTCKLYCSDPNNFQACSAFVKSTRPSSAPKKSKDGFKGPGGCTTEEQCREYCAKNPTSCRLFGESSKIVPVKISSDKQEEVKNTYPVPSGTTKEEYCKTFPLRCVPSPSTVNINSASTTENPVSEPTDYPKSVVATSTPTTEISEPAELNTSGAEPLPTVRGASTGPNLFRTILKLLFGF